MTDIAVAIPGRTGPRVLREAIAARGGLLLLCVALFVFLTVPLAMLFIRSVESR